MILRNRVSKQIFRFFRLVSLSRFKSSQFRKSSLNTKRMARRHRASGTFVFIAMGHAQSGYHGVDAVVFSAMETSGNMTVSRFEFLGT